MNDLELFSVRPSVLRALHGDGKKLTVLGNYDGRILAREIFLFFSHFFCRSLQAAPYSVKVEKEPLDIPLRSESPPVPLKD